MLAVVIYIILPFVIFRSAIHIYILLMYATVKNYTCFQSSHTRHSDQSVTGLGGMLIDCVLDI